MNHSEKLLELCGIEDLAEYCVPASSGELLQNGRYYRDIFDTIKSHDNLHRIENEISWLLAESLQPQAGERYGPGDAASIKQLLSGKCEPMAQENLERQRNLWMTAVKGD